MSEAPLPPEEAPRRNLRTIVEYDGTDFSGWQRQIGRRTVQGTLEEKVHELLGETVEVRGAGRTDAGVHAEGQVASLSLASRIPTGGLLRGLNTILPSDVAVIDVAEVDPAFDARFSARGKVYRYRIWNHFVRSPKHARTSWHLRRPLDLTAMRTCAATLCGEHDFRGFRASDCDRRNTVRVIRRFDITRQGAIVDLEVEATAFLKNMVRILAGTLADVGRGKLDLATVSRVLEGGDRTAGGVTAPARGLTLVRVIY
ncbi:MAG: tRNA pseudouridine(38-40) synthase TruA [Haliangium ochraceum]